MISILLMFRFFTFFVKKVLFNCTVLIYSTLLNIQTKSEIQTLDIVTGICTDVTSLGEIKKETPQD
ncbi:MAG: hypothetical protein CMH44_16445 [Muricauda sp.]|nr:hypothetical protein [Allomuricauda sp.]MBC74057.1 hypothetical protein [Allomuricauda sp.]